MTTTPVLRAPGAGPDATVVGDGTTVMLRARTRWQRLRWPLTALVTFLLLVAASSLLQARTSSVPLAPDNPGAGGGRAVAQILGDQGVEVHYVRTVREARALAAEGTTLVVAGTVGLSDADAADLASVPADLVVVGPDFYLLDTLTGDAFTMDGPYVSGVREAGCDDPDAAAAGQIATDERSLRATGDGVVCFADPNPGTDDAGAGAYGSVERDDRRVVVINDSDVMTNAHLAEHGHAALVLRALGRHPDLVWLVPTLEPVDDSATGGSVDLLFPDWAPAVAAQLLLVLLALALWRGRRLGPVVTEPLPITVRAAEATLGRGRLYRRARARGHAAAALRAGTATRLAARLGLPRTAGATDVIDAVARATGRGIDEISGLLYGPPPTDDGGLLQLARQLDQLESEVHRT